MPEGQKGYSRGEAPGQRNNIHNQPQKGERKKEFHFGWHIYIFGNS